MGNSLQEQLLKAGLVNAQTVKQTRSDKRKQVKHSGGQPTPEEQAARAAADRERAAKIERDRELNRQRQEEAARRAAENEIRQLIHTHRVVRDQGDLAYNFTDGSTLKRLYVNAEQHASLVAGRLAIVRQDTFMNWFPPRSPSAFRPAMRRWCWCSIAPKTATPPMIPMPPIRCRMI